MDLLFSLFSFLISAFLLYLYTKSKWSVLDIPNHRSMHTEPIKKSAGIIFIPIAIIISFLYSKYTIVNHNSIYFLLLGTIFFTIIGFLDDVYNLPSSIKLLLEVIFTYCLFYFFIGDEYLFFGINLALPAFLKVFISSLLLVFIVNLCNFMDGMDLYLSLNALIAFLLFLFFYRTIHKVDIIILSIFASSMIGFMIFNYPPAKMFMGDSGSLPLGFLIGSLSIFSADNPPDVTSNFFFIPFFWTDGIITIFKRLLNKENILKAHKKHLYQRITPVVFTKVKTVFYLSGLNLLSIFLLYLYATIPITSLFYLHIIYFLIYLGIYLFIELTLRKRTL